MYRCPKCNSELPAGAHFCARCGFNQINANLQAANPPGTANNGTPARSGTFQKQAANPGMPTTSPPNAQANNPMYPAAQRPAPPGQAASLQAQTGPAQPPAQPGNNQSFSTSGIRPVRTNTPPIPGWDAQSLAHHTANIPLTQQQQAQANGTQAKSLSLKQRYLAGQAMPYHTAHPSLESGAAMINRPAANFPGEPVQHNVPELSLPVGSLAATSRAAEHWRRSWRERQRAEAGPALGISRGQAAVSEPLMAIQHSIARMRAVVSVQNQNEQSSPGMNSAFRNTFILLICLIGGLCAYIAWTYLPSTPSASAGNGLPTLTVKGANTATVTAGHTLQLRGDHFGPGNTITFILNNTPVQDNAGKQLSVHSSSQGTFNTSLPVPTTWLAGSYALLAQDNQTGQHAFLNIQVLPGKKSTSNTTVLDLTLNGHHIATKGLAFKKILGKGDPAAQQITFRNTGNTTVQWSAAAVADNNLNWLIITTGKTDGNLAAGDTDNVGIGIFSAGLQSNTKAYTGRIIFTIDQTQAIIPVSLLVQNSTLEVIVNPDPVIAQFQPGGFCSPTTLTLINLSNQLVAWSASTPAQAHVHLDNQGFEQGTLQPSGQPGDTKVIMISCTGAQVGEKLYHINVFYNNIHVDVPMSIRH